MKIIFIFIAVLFQLNTYGQENVQISFENDYADVYHLSLIIYTPDGKNQTRVGDLKPGQVKTYSLPALTEIYIADWKQEAFAMKGNDIKAAGVKPTFILAANKDSVVVVLSSLKGAKEARKN
jgi:hypothetical protein